MKSTSNLQNPNTMGEEKPKRSYRIGYALAPKKVDSVIQPSLVSHAKSNGIHLIPIAKSLIFDPPLDCIIHKLYDHHWNQNLAHFSAQHPNIPIIDSPEAVQRLHSRVSMLRVVEDLKLDQVDIKLGIPKQVIISDPETLLNNHTLKFPVIAKPLVANGKDESHKMALVYDAEGLTALKPPLVLQEFVNHGGVIFKVYVAGKHIECVKRPSLPDIPEEKLSTLSGMLPFSQISNVEAHSMVIDKAVMPPMDFVYDMANRLREGLGLNLFNFDMFRDGNDESRYLVIDINYFPGYAKIPSYETMLTNFFLDVVGKEAM